MSAITCACAPSQLQVLPSGKRIPGLKLDNARQLALMHTLVRFAHIAAGSTFTTARALSRTFWPLCKCPPTNTVSRHSGTIFSN